MKSFKQFIEEQMMPHIIFDKSSKKVVSKHPDRESAYKEMIHKHNFHPDMTVLNKNDKHLFKQYGVSDAVANSLNH